MLEERLIRDFVEKSQIEMEDYIVMEDMDGTKLGSVKSLRRLLMGKMIFNTVEEMKMQSLEEGDYCITLGYRSPGDGGGALYIMKYEPTAIEDYGTWHYLYTSDTIRAKFVSLDGTVTPEQFGAYGDGSKDDIKAIQRCIDSKYKVIFNKSKTYRITKAITLKSRLQVDLNNCIIKPSSCSAFTIPTDGIDRAWDVSIRNGRIDMSKAKLLDVISINKRMKNFTIENITIYNGAGTCVNIKGVEKLVINDCEFESTEVRTSAIISRKSDLETSSWCHLFISNTRFVNFLRAISLADNNAFGIITIENCTHQNVTSTASTTFLFNSRTGDTQNRRSITLSEIYTGNVDCLFDNQAIDAFTISNVRLSNAKTLFKHSANAGNVALEGRILLTGDNVADKYPVFTNCGGSLLINTPFVSKNAERYKERSSNGSFGACTLYDNVDILTRGETSRSVPANGSLNIDFVRNAMINITSAGNITGITGGINNQVIGLRSTAGAVIIPSGSVNISSNITLSSTSVAYFRYNSSTGKWNRIYR